MPSTSAIVNRLLRAHVTGVLREAGFEKIDARNGWHWQDQSILVFNIRAVGNYFAGVTGWPPGSIGVWLGAYYPFAATFEIKRDDQGRLLPAEYECHMRWHLECALDQSSRVGSLLNFAEQRRKDIWWIEPDGSNADEVAADVATALREHGLAWFARVSNLHSALTMVEAERDCFMKFHRAHALSREIGDQERVEKYRALAESEGRRIGVPYK